MRNWWRPRSWRHVVLVLAALSVGGFVVLHLAGARGAVGVLSGSSGSDAAVVIGLAYAAAWFATVIAVPIALLALGCDAMLGLVARWWTAGR